ncbi:sulfotransferase [Flammeovirga sp. EKP202]|uniref:sulfotransferase family protein n=1 Tax=Flammeovirga sp. EKP202 TaxID=2770592 RepID=UPI00165F72EA|nr:sulfotransferase [Flammeovirga sp. EKP202]MBD0404481.1 sulfotransferase [Flammeovirga sp. EKP202]
MKNKEVQHVFVISQPRAGSTFLQRILSNHSKIHTVGEPWFLLPIIYNDFDLQVHNRKFYNATWANLAINSFLEEHKDIQCILKQHYLGLYKKITTDLALKNDKFIFIDKTPRYYYIIDSLVKEFPKSKFIILTRNPLDVFYSILKTWVKGNYFLLSRYQDDLFKALTYLKKIKSAENILRVSYEDLLQETNTEVNRICNFLGISFEKEILDISQDKKWRLGDPNMNKKKVIDNSNTKKWKNSLSPQEWRLLNAYIHSLDQEAFIKLGYDLDKTIDDVAKIKPSKLKLFFTFSLSFYFNKFSRKVLTLIYYRRKKVRQLKKIINGLQQKS